MEEPKVSIIMSAYNASSTIKRAIDSVLTSTYRNIELVIIDDCSTDDTENIVKEYTDPRIKYIRHKRNLGCGWSRNHGVKASTGDYTLFVDSDDWIEKDWVENLVTSALKYDSDITSGGMIVETETEDEIILDRLPVAECYLDRDSRYSYGNNIAYRFLSLSLVKSVLWQKVSYCTWRYIEDTTTFVKLLHFANSRYLTSHVGYHYIQNPKSLCHTSSIGKQKRYLTLMIKELYRFAKKYNDNIIKGMVHEKESIQNQWKDNSGRRPKRGH